MPIIGNGMRQILRLKAGHLGGIVFLGVHVSGILVSLNWCPHVILTANTVL